MNRLEKVLLVLVFGLTLQRQAAAQTADIPRLKRIMLQKQQGKDFIKDTSYIDINIGLVFFKKGQYKEALARFLQTLKYFEATDDKMRITRTATWVAKTYLALNDHRHALPYAQQSLKAATGIKAKIQMQDADKVLADIYDANGDSHNALKYFRLYKDVSDSIFNENMLKKTAGLAAKFEYEKKENRLKEVQEKKNALHSHIVRNKELQISIAILVIGSLSALAFLLFRSRAAKQKTNQILEVKNEAIEQQAVQLLLNNQDKDKLFSIIAHDLKMPLHSLRVMLGLLKENDLPPEDIRDIMDELRQDVNYSAELVSNLLSWSASQLAGRVISPANLPVQQLVNDTIEPLLKQAADKRIVITNKLPSSLTIWADKNMMQVLFRNLVSNAIKFCNNGNTITIDHKIVDGAIEICVADTGIGIEKDVLKKINRRESVTTFGTAKEKGSGLGMLLCREFVEANKGNFRIESEVGKGSRFYCRMPATA